MKTVTTRQRPLPTVVLNMSMTADGKIATSNRVVSSFSSKADRHELLKLRATADAVMAGARTIDLNPVTMGPGRARFRQQRIKAGLSEFPLRVIVSGRATIDPSARIFRHGVSPILLLTTACAPKSRLRKLQKLATIKACGREEIDFREAFQWLYEKWGVRRLVCEGGGELNDALLRADLIDELHVTICPFIFGGRTAPTISEGRGSASLAAARQFSLKSMRRVGDELFLVYGRRASG